jgi:hypothetical protein
MIKHLMWYQSVPTLLHTLILNGMQITLLATGRFSTVNPVSAI